jgi:uncharacterized protein (TIGR02996 family)
MPRYEFEEGNSSKFWEIEISGNAVTTTWGKIGTDGQSKEKPFADAAAAKKEYDKLIKEKTGKGYELAGDGDDEGDDEEGDEGEGLGKVASNPGLEAAILRNPGDVAAWQVYGDFLQQEGDKRGEFIAHAIAKKKDDVDADAAGYGESLNEAIESSELIINYKYGMIQSVTVKRADYDSETDVGALATTILKHPMAQFITGVTCGLASYESEENDFGPVAAAIAKSPRAEQIKHVFFGDFEYPDENEMSWVPWGDVSKIWDACPDLESFRIRGSGNGSLGKIIAPNLKSFIVETGGLGKDVIKSITAAQWPQLTNLEIWLGTDEYGGEGDIDSIAPILAGKGLRKVTSLGLKNCQFVDDICEAIVKAPILAQLEKLDLSMGTLGPRGGEAILAAAKQMAHLKELNLNHAYFSDDLVGKLKAAFGKRLILDEVEDESDEDDRYVSVGE